MVWSREMLVEFVLSLTDDEAEKLLPLAKLITTCSDKPESPPSADQNLSYSTALLDLTP